MTDLEMMLGYRIIVTTRTAQNRKHRCKRINKKWKKKYGMRTVEIQEPGKIVFYDQCAFMTQTDYDRISRDPHVLMLCTGTVINNR